MIVRGATAVGRADLWCGEHAEQVGHLLRPGHGHGRGVHAPRQVAEGRGQGLAADGQGRAAVAHGNRAGQVAGQHLHRMEAGRQVQRVRPVPCPVSALEKQAGEAQEGGYHRHQGAGIDPAAIPRSALKNTHRCPPPPLLTCSVVRAESALAAGRVPAAPEGLMAEEMVERAEVMEVVEFLTTRVPKRSVALAAVPMASLTTTHTDTARPEGR